MSGICGFYYRDGRQATAQPICAMLDRIKHRGPDGSAVWVGDSAALGHCMLQTTPESLHEQLPSATPGSALVITSDARIDNRAELFAALGLKAPLVTLSDSDLIVAAYEKWGEEGATHLVGDFAFAIWDQQREILFCACDPVGVKSIYYYKSPQLFAFASEIKSLLALPEVPCRLNELRVAEYLVMLFEDRSGTFYEKIQRLPGASTLTVMKARSVLRQYWSLDPKREIRLSSDQEYVEAFREQFSEAVRCRTRSAFPTGAALSGGLDSSSIACLARNQRTEPLHTFSLIFPGLPAEDRRVIDERAEIKEVLDTGRFVPHFIQADRLSPMGQIHRMHFHLDDANFAPNLYLHWAMYDAARTNGVRVFLDGFDGDATVSHGFERLTELAQTLRWRAVWREAMLLSRNQLNGISPARIIKEYCVKPLTPRWAYLAWHFLRGRHREAVGKNVLISGPLKQRTDIERRARAMLRPQTAWSLTRSARELHWQTIAQGLYAYTLEIADKAAAAFSLEARYPFFDRRVMEFCLALPPEQKLAQGWNRWILRRAMEGTLPPKIQWRRKKANLSPNFHRRLLDFERHELERILFQEFGPIEPYVDREAIRSAYYQYRKTHVRTQGESLQLFAAVNLALWLRSAGFSS
jgi:asparagine synthase (glutamine-hydrolysing)